jgi:hypothetical protein
MLEEHWADKLAKECAAWFADLVILVSGVTSSIHLPNTNDPYGKTNLPHEMKDPSLFSVRMRFFVPETCQPEVILEMMQRPNDLPLEMDLAQAMTLNEITGQLEDGTVMSGWVEEEMEEVEEEGELTMDTDMKHSYEHRQKRTSSIVEAAVRLLQCSEDSSMESNSMKYDGSNITAMPTAGLPILASTAAALANANEYLDTKSTRDPPSFINKPASIHTYTFVSHELIYRIIYSHV